MTVASATKTLALEILAPGISITNASLPTAQKDEAYDVALTALGGTAPYTWALDAGTLPAGLTLDPTTGHISGTPTTVESQALTLKVTSSDNATVTKQLTLTVANLAATPLDDVSCPTANFCLAVDRKAKAYTRTASTDWGTGTDMAGVPQSSMYQNRVSCTSETFCIYLTNAGKAAQFDGTTWTRLPDLPEWRWQQLLLLGHRLRLADQLRRRGRQEQLHDERPQRLRRHVGRHGLGRGDRHGQQQRLVARLVPGRG